MADQWWEPGAFGRQNTNQLGLAIDGLKELASNTKLKIQESGDWLIDELKKPEKPLTQSKAVNDVLNTAMSAPIGPFGLKDLIGEGLVAASTHSPENLAVPLLIGGLALGGSGSQKSRSINSLNGGLDTIKNQLNDLPRAPKPGSPKARQVKKLREKANKLDRTKNTILQTKENNPLFDSIGDNMEYDQIMKEEANFFNRMIGDISVKGLKTPVHHNAMLGTFGLVFRKLDLKKGSEVSNVLASKYGRILGHDKSNFTTLFSERAHSTMAHFNPMKGRGDTKDMHLRLALNKIDPNSSPEEIADRIELQARIADNQAGKAAMSRENVERGFDLYKALPESMRKKLPAGFNPLDVKSPGWKEYSLMLKGLSWQIKDKLNSIKLD